MGAVGRNPHNSISRVLKNQFGITGLETAIVLIAFVVVSSVFAFAALSSGLFAADKSKETIEAGLSESRGTLEVRGAIVAFSTGDAIDEITIFVSNAAGGEAIDLTPGKTLITYTDASQSMTFASGDFTSTGLGGADSDSLVELGESYKIFISGLRTKLNPNLGTDTNFIIEVKPPKGAVIHLNRRTPIILESFNVLG